MSLQQITDGMRQRIEQKGGDTGLGSSVKFDFGGDGIVHLDASNVPNVVSNDDKDADCTITMSMADFIAMTQGDLDATTAFMMGKLRISGNMGIAMKLSSVLN